MLAQARSMRRRAAGLLRMRRSAFQVRSPPTHPPSRSCSSSPLHASPTQVAFQLYEDAPQELRSRLWMALLEHPELCGEYQTLAAALQRQRAEAAAEEEAGGDGAEAAAEQAKQPGAEQPGAGEEGPAGSGPAAEEAEGPSGAAAGERAAAGAAGAAADDDPAGGSSSAAGSPDAQPEAPPSEEGHLVAAAPVDAPLDPAHLSSSHSAPWAAQHQHAPSPGGSGNGGSGLGLAPGSPRGSGMHGGAGRHPSGGRQDEDSGWQLVADQAAARRLQGHPLLAGAQGHPPYCREREGFRNSERPCRGAAPCLRMPVCGPLAATRRHARAAGWGLRLHSVVCGCVEEARSRCWLQPAPRGASPDSPHSRIHTHHPPLIFSPHSYAAVLMTAMMSVPWPLPSSYPPDCRYATLLQIRWGAGAMGQGGGMLVWVARSGFGAHMGWSRLAAAKGLCSRPLRLPSCTHPPPVAWPCSVGQEDIDEVTGCSAWAACGGQGWQRKRGADWAARPACGYMRPACHMPGTGAQSVCSSMCLPACLPACCVCWAPQVISRDIHRTFPEYPLFGFEQVGGWWGWADWCGSWWLEMLARWGGWMSGFCAFGWAGWLAVV